MTESRIDKAAPRPARPIERVDAVVLGATIVAFWIIAATRWNATALWADEVWSLAAVNDLSSAIRAAHGSTIIYYGLAWLWGRASTSTVWLRMLSTIIATGSIVLIALVGRSIGGRRLGRLAPALLITSPMFIWTGTEVRGYALETVLTIAAWYVAVVVCARRTTSRTRRRARWAFAALCLAGPLVHGLFPAQIVAIGCWALIGRRRETRVRALAPGFAATTFVTLVLLVLGHGELGAGVDGGAAALWRMIGDWYFASTDWLLVVTVALSAIGAGSTVVRQIRARNGRGGAPRTEEWIPLLWTLVPILVLFVIRWSHDVWAPYYLAPVAPGAALLAGTGVVTLGRAVRRSLGPRRLSAAVVSVIPLALVAVLAANVTFHEKPPQQDWRGAAAVVAARARPGDGLLFTSGEPKFPVASRPGFEAAWRETSHRRTPPAISPGRPLGEVLRTDDYLPASELSRRLARYDRVWLIDYQGMLGRSTAIMDSSFPTDFRRARTTTFDGAISVALYERVAPSG
jgi:mannosyltransferase